MDVRLVLRIENRILRAFDAAADLIQPMPGGALAVADLAVDVGDPPLFWREPAGRLLDAEARAAVLSAGAASGLPAALEIELGRPARFAAVGRFDGGVPRVLVVAQDAWLQGRWLDLDATPLRDLVDDRQIAALAEIAEATS